jgi:hypothetical protein
MGIRISEEFVALERSALGDEFARERLGHWNDDETAAGESVIGAQAWAACTDTGSSPGDEVAFALDVSPSRDWSSIAIAGTTPTGTHVELTGSGGVVDHRPGTEWLIPRAKELQARWGGEFAVSAGSPAASLISELDDAGLEVVEVKTADHAIACGALFDAVSQGTLRHLGQPDLTVAVAGAERRFYGDAWLWSRRSSTIDISPLVAVTLAKWLADQTPTADFYMI